MSTYIDASHNILRTLTPAKWQQDLAKSARGDITGYQEATNAAARAAVKKHCADAHRGLYHPASCGNPISWRRATFDQANIGGKVSEGVVNAHASAKAMGVPSNVNPERDFTWVGLIHKASGYKVLRINVHTASHGVLPEANPRNTDSAALAHWKDWAIGQYWLDVVSFAARMMSVQDPGVKSMANLWDVVSIGGDYNAELTQKGRWYYPGSLLPALFVADRQPKGIDHLQHSHGSDATIKRRWSLAANSDHKIHFVERTLVAVTDFPRQ
jgi:hypothetical protein